MFLFSTLMGTLAGRIGRKAAFYRHYQDKYDLVEQIFEEAMQTMMHNSALTAK